jgi:hypothetical protein
MKKCGEVEIQLHLFLILAPDGGEWSASRPVRFTPGEWAPGTHWIGWMGPRAGLDAIAKNSSCLCQESKSGRPAITTGTYGDTVDINTTRHAWM